VVTYKTVLKVTNDDLALRPGMTASATIFTATKENALLVPNAALRFTPPKSAQSKEGDSFVASLLPRPPLQPQRSHRADSASPQVWLLRDGKPVAVTLKTGLTNGRQTEVLAGELKAGDAVITEYQELRK
jgi:HlyD family secretion protein